MINEKAYWLAWLQIKGIGAILLKRIHQHFGNVSQAWTARPSELEKVEGLGSKIITQIVNQKATINPQQLLEKHLQNNPHFWTPADQEYPRLLLEIPSPPPILYYRGTVELTENLGSKPAIAIVGTRYPTKYGRDWTRKISQTLTKEGFTIVSGMAAGIDAEAHSACLAARGRTIAVLGTGVDTIYPHSNSQLYHSIQQQGLILSEYPAGTKPDRKNFPSRNRIIAGLSRAVLIMEAPQRSGALITARYANEFCRDVYVLPGSLNNPQSIGCLNLLNRGAHVILGENELLEMLEIMPKLDINPQPEAAKNLSQPEKPPLSDLEPKLAQIIQAINDDSSSLDAIAQKTNLDTGTLLASLSQLELMGLISQLPGMRYQVN
ncbi:Protein Smf [Hyella patelloides LEGE 07179]|uniref:Protein Smf n=1 Tax=Hyella patelloides LEGE 07179 TaxID=945734 RepID=A0A563VN90_9CYAN|nr:DNA-processing protein DprA [Hyella patelloides]VEP12926.1 Protein Smf [Hyella patelloides LEGE 07179]